MTNADIEENEFVHLYIALRRKKDDANEGLKQLCFRELIYNEDSLTHLVNRVKSIGGEWRIHKTINKRSTHKALKLLQHKIIEDPEKVAERLPSEWKTCLMQPKSKAERNILLDIDSVGAFAEANEIIVNHNIEIKDYTSTPNGHHIVIDATEVDTRLFKDIKDLTFQRDGYIYIKTIRGEIRYD